MKRLWCRLWGCWCHGDYPGCGRCGAAIYDADFVQAGKLAWLQNAYGCLWCQTYALFHSRCDVCHGHMWLKKGSCCSPKCYEQWMPF